MGSGISKAVLILVPALAVLTTPVVGQAQTAVKVARIGVIAESSPPDPLVAALRQGLRELGHAEGESILIEERSLEGELDRAPKLAAELIQLKSTCWLLAGR